jgi:hypothetical protein
MELGHAERRSDVRGFIYFGNGGRSNVRAFHQEEIGDHGHNGTDAPKTMLRGAAEAVGSSGKSSKPVPSTAPDYVRRTGKPPAHKDLRGSLSLWDKILKAGHRL